jgi:hypothetical protein
MYDKCNKCRKSTCVVCSFEKCCPENGRKKTLTKLGYYVKNITNKIEHCKGKNEQYIRDIVSSPIHIQEIVTKSFNFLGIDPEAFPYVNYRMEKHFKLFGNDYYSYYPLEQDTNIFKKSEYPFKEHIKTYNPSSLYIAKLNPVDKYAKALEHQMS